MGRARGLVLCPGGNGGDTALLALFPGAAAFTAVAEDVERETMRMIDEAR